MTIITRIDSTERLSRVVIHGDTIYIAGITAGAKGDIVVQTRDVLRKIDEYLATAGSDKRHLLSVQIWLKDITADFVGMNSVWAEWEPKYALQTRATGEVHLAVFANVQFKCYIGSRLLFLNADIFLSKLKKEV